MTYSEALAKLGDRDRRKVANNTYLIHHGDCIAVRLHATDIVTLFPDGRVKYNTGGWATMTTKNRMNGWGHNDVRITSDKGDWFACAGVRVVPYADGLVYDGERFTNYGTDKRALDRARRLSLNFIRYMYAW